MVQTAILIRCLRRILSAVVTATTSQLQISAGDAPVHTFWEKIFTGAEVFSHYNGHQSRLRLLGVVLRAGKTVSIVFQ
jgi:hypothetical protein